MSDDMLSTQTTTGALLDVNDVSIGYDGREVVHGQSFSLDRGEVLGIVGESGSGKTSLGLGVIGLLPHNGHATGEVRFAGRNLLDLPARELRQVRRQSISVIMQNPTKALDPCYTVGAQFVEILRLRESISRRAARAEAEERMRQVGIAAPAQRLKAYPHELSGGMAQRVMVALALATNPALLVADEPTSALDVTIQAQILELLKSVIADLSGGVAIITHDFGIVAQLCTKVCVMSAGRIVEQGPVTEVFAAPRHEYTRHLLSLLPGHALRQDPHEHAAPQPGPAVPARADAVEHRAESAV